MRFLKRNVIIAVLLWGSFIILQAQNFREEAFNFPIKNGEITLSGVLTLPNKFSETDTPLIIFVSPPQAYDKDYGGFFKTLSDSLSSNGIATFRYDNRNFSDTIPMVRNSDRFDVFDISSDAHSAYVSLKNDARFAKTPIGMLGHSEGGNAVAIEASRNPDIRYVVVLSSIGIPGASYSYIQMTSQIESFSEMMSIKERNLFHSMLYNMIKITDSNNDNEKTKRLLEEYLLYLKNKEESNAPGNTNAPGDVISKLLIPAYTQPRVLEYIRFKPELYYSKIKSPILAVCGKRDERVIHKINLDGLERIFIENEKENYEIAAIDGVNHAYEDVDCLDLFEYVNPHPKKRKWQKGEGFDKLCATIISWIKEN